MLKKRSMRHLGEFSQIFKRCSLDFFHEYKMFMGLYIWKKNPSLNFEVVMTYIRPTGNPCSKENQKLFCGVFNSDRNQIKSRSLQKGSQPFRNCEYHKGGLRKCFKVYIAEGVTRICVSPNKYQVRLTQNSVHLVHSLL